MSDGVVVKLPHDIIQDQCLPLEHPGVESNIANMSHMNDLQLTKTTCTTAHLQRIYYILKNSILNKK